MAQFELWINNTKVDLKDSFPLSINSSISDIQQPETRQTTYSKTIVIPASKSNRELFDNIFELSTWIDSDGVTNYTPDFDPNLKATAVAMVDGVELFNGFAQLLLINVRDNNDIEFEITLTGNLVSLFKNIGDNELTDLDFSDLDHDYTRAEIENSWSNTEGYVYPLIDYGFTQVLDNFPINGFFPAIYVKDYWDRIFEDAGMLYDSDFINDTFFGSLIIPFTGASFKISDSEITDRKFRASIITSDLQYSVTNATASNTVIFNDDSTPPNFDNSSQFNTTTGVFTVGTGLQGNFNFGAFMDITVRYVPDTAAVDVKAIQGTVITLSFIKQDAAGNNTVLNTFTLKVREGQSGFTINTDTETTSAYSNPSYINTNTGEIYFQSGSVELIETDKVAVTIARYYSPSTVNGALASLGIGSGFNGTWGTADLFLDSSNNIYGGNYYAKVKVGSYIYNEVSNANYVEGMTISMNNAVPEKIKQKDFIMSLVKMFNLYIEQDADVSNKFKIEPRDDFYLPATSSANIIDLTDKLDISQDLVINPMGSLDFKKYIFKYKDDKDYFNADYLNRWGETYSERQVDVSNDFIVNEKKIDIIFSATPSVGSTSNDRVIPRIVNIDLNGTVSNVSANPRILIWDGLKSTNQVWTITDSSGTTQYTSYPYAGMLDDAYNPTVSLDWEVPDEIYWTNIWNTITYTNKNLYNQFWKKLIDEITDKNSKIVKGWFDIRPYDYVRLDFRKVYYFEREYFRLNKIIDYNPLNNGLTQLEFIKINEGVTTSFDMEEATDVYQVDRAPRFISPTLFGGNTGEGGTPRMVSGEGNRVMGSVRSYSIVGNGNLIGENSNGVDIRGNDNTVAGDSDNVFISGDGNIVQGSNITLINTYDKTINQSNSTYINGRCVSGDSSVIYVSATKTVTTSGDDDAITYLCDATSGNITFNLPSAADFGMGNYLNIKKVDSSSNSITIDGNSSETIDDATTFILNVQYDSITIQSDGTNWQII